MMKLEDKNKIKIISEGSNLFRAIEKASKIKKYQKGEMIYYQDDPSDKFFMIKSGMVRLFLNSDEGNELTLKILGENQIFGESSYFTKSPRITSVNTITDVELLVVDSNLLLLILTEDPPILMEMFEFMGERIQLLCIQIYSMLLFSADKKIAYILVHLGPYYKEHKSDSFYEIDYTHQDISNLVGVTRVTATKVLNLFEKKGWILLEYRKIKVVDEIALKKYLL